MADDKLARKRNTGAEPVQAHPNHVREKTYDAPDMPPKVREEKEALPENTARDKLREEMPEAAHQVEGELRKHG